MLRRLVLILMLALLPVQWTWAAAASVCQHEEIVLTDEAHAHFGHHEHQHEGAPADAGTDSDCPSCHFAAPVLPMPQQGAQAPLLAASPATPYLRSITAGLPERLIRPPHQFLVA